MSLSIIGAGFGRTGTHSLKRALETLGLRPCYHMEEVIANPDHAPFWRAAADSEQVDWSAMLDPYRAIVDWPGVYFWRELARAYPTARLVLTVRDTGRWYQSAYDTIFQGMTEPDPDDPSARRPKSKMSSELILKRTFGGRFADADYAMAVYDRHNEEVRQSIPAERLLVYDVSDGWAPLCTFLGCPLPGEPFPKSNTSAEFKGRFLQQQ